MTEWSELPPEATAASTFSFTPSCQGPAEETPTGSFVFCVPMQGRPPQGQKMNAVTWQRHNLESCVSLCMLAFRTGSLVKARGGGAMTVQRADECQWEIKFKQKTDNGILGALRFKLLFSYGWQDKKWTVSFVFMNVNVNTNLVFTHVNTNHMFIYVTVNTNLVFMSILRRLKIWRWLTLSHEQQQQLRQRWWWNFNSATNNVQK